MTPDTPLDIQWFAYALNENGVLDDAGAQALREELGNTDDLGVFAQTIVERLCAEIEDEAEQEAVIEQIQQLVDFACEHADSGELPESAGYGEEAVYEDAAEAPQAEAGQDAEPEFVPPPVEKGKGISQETAIHFEMPDYDLSGVNGYEDLPSLSDTPYLSDAELADRMIYLLACLRHLGCSDLHISGGAPPFVRRLRRVERLDSYILTAEDSKRLNLALLSPERCQQFAASQDMSMALEIGTSRFRLCLMETKDGVAGSYRLVPEHILSLEELGFLDKDIVYIKRLLDYNNGLILVTGPIGAGKTTTLAAMTNIVNQKRQDHIISVEDPIEILQVSQNCQVSQREVGRHTISYRTALKAALREDPDVIVIGEMHDLETIENAITASETGHLVIGTLHTSDAPNTLNRLLDVFPPSQQPQIRAMTAGSLRGVICQKLIDDGFGGLTLIYEIMLNTMSVANIINEGKTFRLKSTIVTAFKQGMCSFDQCILAKFEQNLITKEAALAEMRDEATIEQLMHLWAQREVAAAKQKR